MQTKELLDERDDESERKLKEEIASPEGSDESASEVDEGPQAKKASIAGKRSDIAALKSLIVKPIHTEGLQNDSKIVDNGSQAKEACANGNEDVSALKSSMVEPSQIEHPENNLNDFENSSQVEKFCIAAEKNIDALKSPEVGSQQANNLSAETQESISADNQINRQTLPLVEAPLGEITSSLSSLKNVQENGNIEFYLIKYCLLFNNY